MTSIRDNLWLSNIRTSRYMYQQMMVDTWLKWTWKVSLLSQLTRTRSFSGLIFVSQYSSHDGHWDQCTYECGYYQIGQTTDTSTKVFSRPRRGELQARDNSCDKLWSKLLLCGELRWEENHAIFSRCLSISISAIYSRLRRILSAIYSRSRRILKAAADFVLHQTMPVDYERVDNQ